MSIQKSTNGWRVDIQPNGRGGKRYRKTLKTQAEAKAYEAWVISKVKENPDWQPAKKEERKLSNLVMTWFEHHGSGLRAGKNTFSRLNHLCQALGDPRADKFTAEMFAEYRRRRIEVGISQNNLNREHAYLRSVFNELTRLGYWSGENPLANIRQFKIQEKEMTFLTLDQIERLFVELKNGRNSDALTITKVCLATGARWSEAETLRHTQLQNGLIQFARTKSGKNRSIPVSSELFDELLLLSKTNVTGRLFKSAASAFRSAIDRTGIKLPEGQLTHVLRHTFASHFMINGGNILTLQRILGHSTLAMTMRYAHLAPDHLQEAVKFNPLSQLKSG